MKSKKGSLLLEACLSLMIVTLLVLVVYSTYQILDTSKETIDNVLIQSNQEVELQMSQMERCDEECLEEKKEIEGDSSLNTE